MPDPFHPHKPNDTIMQNILLSLGLVASAAVGALASSPEFKIEVTQPVKCDRKTKNGDGIQVHYRGTFAGTDKQFDSSMSLPHSCISG